MYQQHNKLSRRGHLICKFIQSHNQLLSCGCQLLFQCDQFLFLRCQFLLVNNTLRPLKRIIAGDRPPRIRKQGQRLTEGSLSVGKDVCYKPLPRINMQNPSFHVCIDFLNETAKRILS
ncbi:MAG: hypothetical protein CRU78_13415 [Candidatus Accumulibacter phosphatis]|uniref:Uncharacterized protein n=1 Tax=Candidatus Accumulibacter phosphatis TaxID=327160 RepID=A0A6A7RV57_9PROT|nr:hypothetical protein [Candidatus Accumulibacter phosphatis]